MYFRDILKCVGMLTLRIPRNESVDGDITGPAIVSSYWYIVSAHWQKKITVMAQQSHANVPLHMKILLLKSIDLDKAFCPPQSHDTIPFFKCLGTF